ncbi:hypothetical protein RHGRI_036236 [Rhododendron griersonianum]|uniref:non-specific serine/threonine protein kinase n=1 Tax=Rhododendron griersonianum TaxID=479676 RepID=A0AAV6HR59_9ERIC|nr:hypothetical protein RHGRI_036236 [Rhododendron griersonianum]
MPFPMRIQLINFIHALEEPARYEPVKPAAKLRLKRLFERQFVRVSTAKKIAGDEEVAAHCKRENSGDFEPSFVCLENMVQNFVEDEDKTAKYSRNRCNCFNRNCSYSLDDELDSFGDACEILKDGDSSGMPGAARNTLPFAEMDRVIDLNYNHLVGEISEELSSLSTNKLKVLYVSVNELTGTIPLWLGNASSLLYLSMAENNLHGRVPSKLGSVSSLLLLQIRRSYLSGEVSPSIYNISPLLTLDIGDNQFYGSIPQDIGLTLSNLLCLYVGRNQFTTHLPVSLSNASRLQKIDFGDNHFTKTMLKDIGSLKDLVILAVGGNQLETDDVEGLSFLTSLTNCSNLQVLDIGSNRFKGESPSSIANFSTALQELFAGQNQISGSIQVVTNLIGLTRLVISRNSITGEIPKGIGKLQRLEELHLHENRFSGAVPGIIGNITKLRRLYLFKNNLSGNIPRSLGNCKQLEVLSLYGNNLTGPIPKAVVSLSATIDFNLAHNSMTGPLPMEVGDMSNLVELDASNNRLSGEIPSTLSKCIMLESLSLGHDLFGGRIPSALSTLKSLNFLDLSRNKLSGQIPTYLQNFTLLQYLNLSHNNLHGEVPQEGVFINISSFSIVGNIKLCGGIKNFGLPSCQLPEEEI